MIFTVKISLFILFLIFVNEVSANGGYLEKNYSANEFQDVYYPSLNWSDEFDWKLFKSFNGEEANILISPFSLKIALAVIFEGSGGLTESELQKCLFFETKESTRLKYSKLIQDLKNGDENTDIRIATRLFLDSDIIPRQKYSSNVKVSYYTEVEPTNFIVPDQAAKKINTWVSNETNGLISDLVTPADLDDVVLLVANTVFFKGFWSKAFPKNNTYSSNFYTTPTSIVTVDYMHTVGQFYYTESKELDSQILRIPYKGNKFGFFIVLPNEKAGLSKLINSLDLMKIKRTIFSLDDAVVDVTIPKFKFDYSRSFASSLQNLGLQQMFADTASLPGIARGLGYGYKKLQVNDIRQKSGITIDEDGSTIYVATDIQVGNKFGDVDIVFNVTYPFMFFVEDQTSGSIIFIGKVVNPLAKEPIAIPLRLSENIDSKSSLVG